MGSEVDGRKTPPRTPRSLWTRLAGDGRDIKAVGAGIVVLMITLVLYVQSAADHEGEAVTARESPCQVLYDLANELLEETPGPLERTQAQEMLDSGLGERDCTVDRYVLKNIAAGDYSPGGSIYERRLRESAALAEADTVSPGRSAATNELGASGDSDCAERIAAILDLGVDAQSEADMVDAIRIDCGMPPLQQDEFWLWRWESRNG